MKRIFFMILWLIAINPACLFAQDSTPHVVVENWSSSLPLDHLVGGDRIEVRLKIKNLSEEITADHIHLNIQTPPGIHFNRIPKLRRLKPRQLRTLKLTFSVHPGLPSGSYPIRIIPTVENQNTQYPKQINFNVVGPQYNLRLTYWGGTYWPNTNDVQIKCGIVNEGPDISDQFYVTVMFKGELWKGPIVQRLSPGEVMDYGPFHHEVNWTASVIPIQFRIHSTLDRNNDDNSASTTIQISEGPVSFGFGFN